MKYILLILTILFFSSCSQAEETNSKKDTQRTEEKQTLSEADKKWLEEYMKLEEEGENLKEEGKALDKLNQTADELLKTVGADK